MLLLIGWMLICDGSMDTNIIVTDVDLVELNYCHSNMDGSLSFKQFIYYRWSADRYRYDVIAWRLADKTTCQFYWSTRQQRYIAIWYDGDQLRMVRSIGYRVTLTRRDPELIEREVLPASRRAGL